MDNLNKLKEFESSQGRLSIGYLSDTMFSTIDPDDINTETKLFELLAVYGQYIDTTLDENGEIAVSPKWNDIPFRYVANKEGYFIVGDKVSRIFKSGLVTVDTIYLNYLQQLYEVGNEIIDPTGFFPQKCIINNKPNKIADHPKCHVGLNCRKDVIQGSAKNDNDRVTIKLITVPYNVTGPFRVSTYLKVTSEHKALFWWPEKHTISCSGNVVVHKHKESIFWDKDSVSFDKTKKCFTLFVPIADAFIGASPEVEDNYHYWSYYVTASTPKAGPAIIKHIH